jgi:hypothetical protein
MAYSMNRYMHRPKLTSREDLLCALHRAVVEVFTFREAGLPLTDSSRPGVVDSEEMAGSIRQVEVVFEEGKEIPVLKYPTTEAKNVILEGMKVVESANIEVSGWENEGGWEELEELESKSESVESESTIEEPRSPEPSSVQVAATPSTTPTRLPISETFLSLPLTDSSLKFAVRPTLPFPP